MLWALLFSFPLMAGVQEISAWIGRVTGMGIAANIRRYYSPWVLHPIVVLLLIANVINLGADIGAMGSALKLLIGGLALLYSVRFGIVSAKSRGADSISSVFTDTQMGGVGAAGLRRDRVCGPRALAICAGGHVYTTRFLIIGLYVRPDGSIWHHD